MATVGVIEVRSALGETQTWDEGIHISAGYAYLKLGDFSWNVEHPALVKLVSALPLTRLGLVADIAGPNGERKDQIRYGRDFLYQNRRPADTILIAARSPNILLTLLFIVAIAWWTRRRWGPAAGLGAAALCAFDPNLIAHGRYVTTDFPLTVFFFFACVLWVEYLEDGSRKRLLAAVAAITLAMLVKFSAILLAPPLVLLYAICWIRRPKEFPVRRALLAGGATIVVLSLSALILYWPDTLRCLRGKCVPLASVVKENNPIGVILVYLGRKLHLPAHAYLYGLGSVAEHNAGGHDSYLMGLHSSTGFWYYFPVVFAVKSTLAALAATLAVVCAGLWAAARGRLRKLSPMTFGLLLPPIIYFFFSMTSGINLGMRHILPCYPFLYVGVAAILARPQSPRWCAALLFVLAGVQIAESASIYPDYLAFFNAAAGGPGRGPEYLVDSNIDWGQDVKKMRDWLARHGTRRARIYYFGNVEISHYGVQDLGFPEPLDQKGWDAIDDFVIVNVTPLMGTYAPLEDLAPVRLREPIAKIGWSMYVYDFRKPKPAPPPGR